MIDISENIKKVRTNIHNAAKKAMRAPSDIKLIAVSKTVTSESVTQAMKAGAAIFGENRVQESRKKIETIGHDVEWHFIGHLQKNKVKYIFDLFNFIHSVDSVELAEEIDKRAKLNNKVMGILLQINVSGEESKFGFHKDSAIEAIKKISEFKDLSIKGLMTIPPFSDNPEDSRKYFKELVSIREKINSLDIDNVSMEELSMGMSNDYDIAVEEGATMVRVGSAIFGERQ